MNFLVASEKFALQACALAHLAEEPDRQPCIRQLRQRYGHGVVVTLGEKGVIADDGQGYCRVPAYPARTVDTTAAGDILSVCMILLHEYPDVPAKLKLANTIVSQFIEGQRALIPSFAGSRPARYKRSGRDGPLGTTGLV